MSKTGAPRADHTLVLGGARSGKTRRALALVEGYSARIYIATAQAFDDEMAERIARHREERGEGWRTVESPIELPTAVAAAAAAVAPSDRDGTAICVDCLTLWLSNLMLADRDLTAATDALLAALTGSGVRVVLVSNEVGLGIVPENALARRFRDAQGRLNQRIAAAAGHVEFVAAGLPLRLK